MAHVTRTSPEPGISDAATDRITYGAVHVRVTDLEPSLRFWCDVVGLRRMDGAADGVWLGVAGRPLVVLHPGADRPTVRGTAGLFHLAIHLPRLGELARALVRFSRAGVPMAGADHVFSKAGYATAPDGIGLELTVETMEEYGSARVTAAGPIIIDRDGRPRSPTEALDVARVMDELPATAPDDPLADGAFIGHVHLHVGDVDHAADFYRDVLGFEDHMRMPTFGMNDLSAGGRFPHRLALNNWAGRGAVQPPPGSAGLAAVELRIRDAAVWRGAAEAAGAQAIDGGPLELLDPAGNRLLVTADRV